MYKCLVNGLNFKGNCISFDQKLSNIPLENERVISTFHTQVLQNPRMKLLTKFYDV